MSGKRKDASALGQNVITAQELAVSQATTALLEIFEDTDGRFDASVRGILNQTFPVLEFIAPDDRVKALDELTSLFTPVIPEGKTLVIQEKIVDVLVRYFMPPAKTEPLQEVSVRISEIPVTLTLKIPTGMPYESEMISLTQVPLHMSGMVYYTKQLPDESLFDANCRAVREATALLTQTLYKMRSDLFDERRRTNKTIPGIDELSSPDYRQASAGDEL